VYTAKIQYDEGYEEEIYFLKKKLGHSNKKMTRK